MLWLASSPGPLPAVLHELGFAPDRLTLTMEGLEITPITVSVHGERWTNVLLQADAAGRRHVVALIETSRGWGRTMGLVHPNGITTWWEAGQWKVETALVSATPLEALEEAVFVLVGTTDDARLEAMGA